MRSAPERILVIYEHGRAGGAAIDLARGFAETADANLTVVAVAPQAPSGSRCGNSATEYNEIVAESVAQDLDKARERLGPAAAHGARFELLIEKRLEEFARAGGFDLVLLPARRRPLRKPGHPAASALSRVAGAEIQIVEPASRAHESTRR